MYQLCEHALTLRDTPEDRKEYVNKINSYGWYQLVNGEFAGCEKTIRRGIELDASNEYLYTNLPPALLFQGKYDKAKQMFKERKDKPWTVSSDYSTYGEVYLDDFASFEQEPYFPKITNKMQKQIDAIKSLLKPDNNNENQ